MVFSKKNKIQLFSFALIILTASFLAFVPRAVAAEGCTAKGCHWGTPDIVPMTLPMMQLIKKNGQRHGDADGCIICHGGNPNTSKKKKAHRSVPTTLLKAAGPKSFYPDPGAIQIAQNTCGVCHPGYVYRARRSLMNTAAGKIQGSMRAWGMEEVKNHRVIWGNYEIEDTDGPVPMGGSKTYESYMADMIRQFPEQYPEKLSQLPHADIKQIEKDPKLAGFVYQRLKCQRCHIGVRGRETDGDYRGMGCSACHMTYNNTPKESTAPAGKITRHRIAGNAKTGGIPVETCNACHNRGKNTGVSYLGLMESGIEPGFNDPNPHTSERHGRNYLSLSGDLHHHTDNSSFGNPKGGLLCQDCHTSLDVHGDGNIHGNTFAQVEIECTDCHGTPEKMPWELPVGYGDEFGKKTSSAPRGTTTQILLSERQFGPAVDPRDGFLLTARGNPLANAVRKKNEVIVYSARGLDFKVPLLKQIKAEEKWKNMAAQTAMSSIPKHIGQMECYTCHSSWAPQKYGRRIKIDFSDPRVKTTDWLASGSAVEKNGQTAESRRGSTGILAPGKVESSPVFLRWEDPVLGINGENRISPLIPGTQVAYTIIGQKKKMLAQNHTPVKTIKKNGTTFEQLAMDTAPAQPHTNQRQARACIDCHASKKTAGLGMQSNRLQLFDWTQIVNEQGAPTATVGSHWPLSRPFDKKQIDGFIRTGVCLGCHSNMKNTRFWQNVSTKGTLDAQAHEKLMNQAIIQLEKSQRK